VPSAQNWHRQPAVAALGANIHGPPYLLTKLKRHFRMAAGNATCPEMLLAHRPHRRGADSASVNSPGCGRCGFRPNLFDEGGETSANLRVPIAAEERLAAGSTIAGRTRRERARSQTMGRPRPADRAWQPRPGRSRPSGGAQPGLRIMNPKPPSHRRQQMATDRRQRPEVELRPMSTRKAGTKITSLCRGCKLKSGGSRKAGQDEAAPESRKEGRPAGRVAMSERLTSISSVITQLSPAASVTVPEGQGYGTARSARDPQAPSVQRRTARHHLAPPDLRRTMRVGHSRTLTRRQVVCKRAETTRPDQTALLEDREGNGRPSFRQAGLGNREKERRARRTTMASPTAMREGHRTAAIAPARALDGARNAQVHMGARDEAWHREADVSSAFRGVVASIKPRPKAEGNTAISSQPRPGMGPSPAARSGPTSRARGRRAGSQTSAVATTVGHMALACPMLRLPRLQDGARRYPSRRV